jgi:trk system potassium uptake protein TrkH
VLISLSAALTGLASEPVEAVRKGVFHIISANSGTGHQTIYAAHWQSVLGGAGFLAVTLAMAFGGSVSSTAGGIKAMRFGLITKAMKQRVREAMSPRSALVREKYQHIVPRVLRPEMVGSALAIFTLYVVSYVSGGAVAALYGYPVDAALFESVSATANVGLSAGITSYSMPAVLKVLYIVQMWVGRLEFVAVFALVIAVIGFFRRPIGRTS